MLDIFHDKTLKERKEKGRQERREGGREGRKEGNRFYSGVPSETFPDCHIGAGRASGLVLLSRSIEAHEETRGSQGASPRCRVPLGRPFIDVRRTLCERTSLPKERLAGPLRLG